ncbi:ABC transporter permease subunit [Acetobacter sp. TBRC 12305]|uniref:ABC transporter permease subunit n=1 Tax=Acetobacter garciniae TaxID=2817435 RepID=A0A939HNH5_9PROT|nr:ABC transporter permease subunit [Acetobacter garciniae]MBO1324226.1 ABC transporter permease subunit [Acetobacter garciniae]MBX0343915.1 ABC transporter permease subunit [Acetobacter garciniae]
MNYSQLGFSSQPNLLSSITQRYLNRVDVLLLVCVAALAIGVGTAVRHMLGPLVPVAATPVHLEFRYLPGYALRTTLRMFAALALSLVFTFGYATLAARSRRARQLLLPLLDVLQSVPILGFLTFTVTFFLGLFPGRVLGGELAAIFTIFTSQAWNMTLGMYQSLRSVPADLEETARCFGLTSWQKFWRLEVPCAVPSLVWNAMISMAGGWFMVVYSESITVGNTDVVLPGVGSYVGVAIEQQNIAAVGAAIVAMMVVILIYDQVLFRPLAAWAARFRLGTGAGGVQASEPWFLRLVRRTRLLSALGGVLLLGLRKISYLPLGSRNGSVVAPAPASAGRGEWLWRIGIGAIFMVAFYQVWVYGRDTYTLGQIEHVFTLGGFTLLRVISMLVLASLIWVPLGVWFGLNPARARAAQLAAQYCAAFPANLFFPVFVVGIVHFHLTPDIWLTPLMILGAQWYILFNVIAGTSSFPVELLEVCRDLNVKGWFWWRRVLLPGIMPYYLVGAIAASGGAWNAAIASEMAEWGSTTLTAHGLGAYIAQATQKGDMSEVGLGTATMCVLVMLLNTLFWRPFSDYAARRLKLN